MLLRRLLSPRILAATVLAVVLVGVAVRLGLWQYAAFGERRAAEASALSTEPPRPLDEVIGPDAPFPASEVGAPVVIEGTWLNGETFFVGGRPQAGREGYWVVTPLVPGDDADGSALLVVRGWVGDPGAAPEPPTGRAELVAWLQPGEGAGLVDEDPADDVLAELRIADALQRVDRDLYGAYAVVADRAAPGDWPVGERATNAATAGLLQARPDELPQPARFTAARNLFYAVEWWIFGAFAAFVWWRFVRDELAVEAAPGVEAAPDGGAGPGADDQVRSDA